MAEIEARSCKWVNESRKVNDRASFGSGSNEVMFLYPPSLSGESGIS